VNVIEFKVFVLAEAVRVLDFIMMAISAFLSYIIARCVQSRGIKYEMIKDHFNDLKENVIKPWLQISEKAKEEISQVSYPPEKPLVLDVCLEKLDRGEPPSDYDVKIDKFLYEDLIKNHYQELEEKWRNLLETLYRRWRELGHDIADKAKPVAQREAQKLGIDWFSVRDYEGLLMRTIVDYTDKFEKLPYNIRSEERSGKVYYVPKILNYYLPECESKEKANREVELCLKLLRTVVSEKELLTLRDEFLEVDKRLEGMLNEWRMELRRLLYKKALRSKCDSLEN
jgi:hypothetical protein